MGLNNCIRIKGKQCNGVDKNHGRYIGDQITQWVDCMTSNLRVVGSRTALCMAKHVFGTTSGEIGIWLMDMTHFDICRNG